MTAPQEAQGAAPRLARHLARCTPCRDGLDAMSAQRGVLATIGRSRSGDGEGVHLVDEVLEACAQDGREKLADLLYEMAYSCVLLIPEDLKPGEVTKNPDPNKRFPVEVLAGTAVEVSTRLSGACLGDGELPERAPEPGMAAKAARSCLALLEQVEGATARRRFSEAFVAQAEKDHERVIEVLAPMHEEELPEWLWLGVRWLLMAAYLRTDRPSEALAIGERALKVCPDDRALLFNTATAHASLGDVTAFEQTCEALSKSHPQLEDAEWWRSLREEESPWLASQLGLDVDVVRAKLQLFTTHGGVDG